MSKEFKPGDLALVVRSRSGLNLGKCVTIERRLNLGETLLIAEGVQAYVNKPGWLVSGDIQDVIYGRLFSMQRHAFEDSGLMPLKGDEQPAQVRQAERVQ